MRERGMRLKLRAVQMRRQAMSEGMSRAVRVAGSSASLVPVSAALLATAALSLAPAPGAQAAEAVHVSCGETITKDTKLANDRSTARTAAS
jgi:hypothetical protein